MPQANDKKDEFLHWWHLLAKGAPEPKTEFLFAKEFKRRFRADFAWPETRVIVEIDGGAYVRGRHTRGVGFESDCKKFNMAAAMKYRVFRFTPGMLQKDPDGCVAQVLVAVRGLKVGK